MTERLRSGSYANSNLSAKMANDLSPRKTMLVIVIVAGCFAVLWPKVFYPMLVGSAYQQMKPSPIDKTSGCCDVISEIDINTIKIMSELCRTIIKHDEDPPLSGREIVVKCQNAVLDTCGIDISSVLQKQVKLGHTVKQILDEIRSLNGSLCLKYNFGVAPWKLGVPHRITVMPSNNIRQERPLNLKSETVHPAFRERGRAIPTIPQPHAASPPRPPPRIIEGRPGPIPAMRPTLGGAGHVVPPPKQGTGSMGLIMPIYTVGIVIFFAYTVMKIVFKKQPEALYPPVDPDPHFRREVFESERGQLGPKLTRENISSKLVVNAMSSLLDEVDQEIEARRKANEVNNQDVMANGTAVKPQEEDQSSVKVLGMETTASCEGGKRWSRPDSPVLPTTPPQASEPVEPPQEIYLEGSLPAQSHLLVADSATEAQKTSSEEDPAVVLAGKMTLSVISLDSSENGTNDSSNSGNKQSERSSSNVSEEFEKIEIDSLLEQQIDNILEETQTVSVPKDAKEPEAKVYGDLLEQLENELRILDSANIVTKLEVNQVDDLPNIEETLSKTVEDLSKAGKDFLDKEVIENELQKTEINKSVIKEVVETGTTNLEEPVDVKDEALDENVELGNVDPKVTIGLNSTQSKVEKLIELDKQGLQEEIITDIVIANKDDNEINLDNTEKSALKTSASEEEPIELGKRGLQEEIITDIGTTNKDNNEINLENTEKAALKTNVAEVQDERDARATDVNITEQDKIDLEKNVDLLLLDEQLRVKDVENSLLGDNVASPKLGEKEDEWTQELTQKERISLEPINSEITPSEKEGTLETQSDTATNKSEQDSVENSLLENNVPSPKLEENDEVTERIRELMQKEGISLEKQNNEEITPLEKGGTLERQPDTELKVLRDDPVGAIQKQTVGVIEDSDIEDSIMAVIQGLTRPETEIITEKLSESEPEVTDPSEKETIENASKTAEDNNITESVSENDAIQKTQDEKETFDRLNAAISDLSAELRSENSEVRDRFVPIEAPNDAEEEEDEEVEYEEYEESDNEEVDEEIRNVDRLDNLTDQVAVEQVNGDDQEQSKYASTSSATMAENEISDEENSQNENEDEDEEVEIEEIIEYITDDEEEEAQDDGVHPAERNNVNHVNERSGENHY